MFLHTEGSSEIQSGDLKSFQAGEINVGRGSELGEELTEPPAGDTLTVVTGDVEVADLENEIQSRRETEGDILIIHHQVTDNTDLSPGPHGGRGSEQEMESHCEVCDVQLQDFDIGSFCPVSSGPHRC